MFIISLMLLSNKFGRQPHGSLTPKIAAKNAVIPQKTLHKYENRWCFTFCTKLPVHKLFRRG